MNFLQHQEKHTRDYPDAVIPAVGIFSKLCLRMTQFHRDLCSDENIYLLLLRSLLLFYKHDAFRTDCSIALFMLSYSEYCIAEQHNISIPARCSDRLAVPLRHLTHWHQSHYNKTSDLEELLLNEDKYNIDELQTTAQYIRLTFASNWFDGFDRILKVSKHSIEGLSISDYCQDGPILKFDKSLCLNKCDLALIRATSPAAAIRHWIHKIENATNHAGVMNGIANIENHIVLPRIERRNLRTKDLINAVQRFYMTLPNTDIDVQVFVAVERLLATLVTQSKLSESSFAYFFIMCNGWHTIIYNSTIV